MSIIPHLQKTHNVVSHNFLLRIVYNDIMAKEIKDLYSIVKYIGSLTYLQLEYYV